MPVSLQLVLVFALAVLLTALWLRLARGRRWLDHPTSRSSHDVPTSTSGGVGFVVVYVSYLCWQREELLPGWQGALVLAGVGTLALMGLMDDFRNLGIGLRLLMQCSVVAALAPFLDQLPPLILYDQWILDGFWLMALLALALLWLVNLYNFMDGIDALAAVQAIFFCVAVSWLASPVAEQSGKALLALGVAVCGFLFFNLPAARLFMGDVGSNFLGLVLPLLGLLLVQQGALNYWTLLILFSTFVADSTTTLLGRFRAGAVWYHPHRTHAYQLLALRWKSHALVVAAYTAINLLWLLPLAWLSLRYTGAGMLITFLAWAPLVTLVHLVRKNVGAVAN
jgi:Fuc2NAc and GlcNAc transferase